jgi:hypothetical protein
MTEEPPTRIAEAPLSSTVFAIDAAFIEFSESISGRQIVP